MADPFAAYSASLDGPAIGGVAVTPHDTNELSSYSRALYVGGSGNLTVVMADGSTVLFNSVPAGTLLPIRCKIVKSTGTAATLITAIW